MFRAPTYEVQVPVEAQAEPTAEPGIELWRTVMRGSLAAAKEQARELAARNMPSRIVRLLQK